MVRFLFPLLVVIITVEGHATAGHLSNITGHPTQDDGSMNIVAEYVDVSWDFTQYPDQKLHEDFLPLTTKASN